MIIAIDGTLASGKGTIAKRLSAWLELPHMDTGRLYRATGVAALQQEVDFDDPCALADVAQNLDLSAYDEAELRTAEAGLAASRVAAVPEVRAALLDLQRRFAHQPGGAILDGRDIGTHLPRCRAYRGIGSNSAPKEIMYVYHSQHRGVE